MSGIVKYISFERKKIMLKGKKIMSDVIVKLIPTEPNFVPDDASITMIKERLAPYKPQYILTEQVRFIDQGRNFESVSCPFCSSNIELDWWSKAMDRASEESFQNLHIVVDCCNNKTSLNDLHYKWNAGFSRFSIEIMNPKVELTEENMKYLEQLLDCQIKKVVAYY